MAIVVVQGCVEEEWDMGGGEDVWRKKKKEKDERVHRPLKEEEEVEKEVVQKEIRPWTHVADITNQREIAGRKNRRSSEHGSEDRKKKK